MKSLNFKEILSLETVSPIDTYKIQRPIVLYGAGGFAEASLKVYKSYNIEPIAICDSNPNKIGSDFFGYTIKSFDEVISQYTDFDIAITAFKYYDEIKSFLLRYIPPEKIVSPVNENYTSYSEQYRSLINNNQQSLNTICSEVSDSKSVQVLENILKASVSNDISYFDAVRTGDQYFPEGIINLSHDEYFIDAGAFYGDTLQEFIQKVDNKYGRVYSFEPFAECFLKLEDIKYNIYNNDNRISLFKYGLYSDNRRVGFNNSIGVGATRVDENFNDINSIDVVSIDNTIKDKVTLIKMDIEGSELAALKGAKNTILKYKPKLAICIYHKPEDIIEIPEFIMDLGLEYKYYFRHHGISPFIQNETVFYAV